MTKSPIYIFVHGAWHAAWCWQKVAEKMRKMGFSVLTPDLPGHGVHEAQARTTTLADYVASVVQLVESQNQPVILVGHSMGGIVISQVAELIPEKIAQLIYVAAYIPKHFESLLSVAGRSASRELTPFTRFDNEHQLIYLDSKESLADIFYAEANKEDAALAISQLRPQPLLPFKERVALSQAFLSVKKKAIICTLDKIIYQADQLRMSEAVTDNIVFLNTDHSPFISKEDELIKELI